MTYKNLLKSDCHCGNIHVELHTNLDAAAITSRICQCGLCKQHSAKWVSDAQGEAKLQFKDKDSVSFYRFGHSTSDFIICKNCGVLMAAVCKLDDNDRAVINITPMTKEVFSAPSVLTDFDYETVDERLARRARNWIGKVTIES